MNNILVLVWNRTFFHNFFPRFFECEALNCHFTAARLNTCKESETRKKYKKTEEKKEKVSASMLCLFTY